MDPLLPRLEGEERRRRGRTLFRHSKIPVRMLVPNFFTLLSLCAGLTAIRMAIEQRYEMAIALVVIAAALDGVDGRLARALKAQSKFGAELDSLADFVNFGVAPAVIVFVWGLTPLKGFGWIAVLVFALAMGLRLARFNAMIDVERPKWQSNYFTGMPAPAGAITVLLPLYVHHLGLFDVQVWPVLVSLYVLAMAFLLVSTIPTFSGKLMGERISREYVMPMFVGVAAVVALLVTYPYGTLTLLTLLYLVSIPLSYRRFQQRLRDPALQQYTPAPAGATEGIDPGLSGKELPGARDTKH
jgi:CDP-diacylglycerol--serine O-phosphatidyltransferase